MTFSKKEHECDKWYCSGRESQKVNGTNLRLLSNPQWTSWPEIAKGQTPQLRPWSSVVCRRENRASAELHTSTGAPSNCQVLTKVALPKGWPSCLPWRKQRLLRNKGSIRSRSSGWGPHQREDEMTNAHHYSNKRTKLIFNKLALVRLGILWSIQLNMSGPKLPIDILLVISPFPWPRDIFGGIWFWRKFVRHRQRNYFRRIVYVVTSFPS